MSENQPDPKPKSGPPTAIIRLRASPGVSKERIGFEGYTLKVWVTEKATDGEANKAVVQAIAKALGVAKTSVTLIKGHKARLKTLEVVGIDQFNAEKKLKRQFMKD